MSGKYRGNVRVAGSVLKGWLIDAARPSRNVRFNLIVDNQLCGTHVANRRRKSFFQQSVSVEDAHGFSIPIRRAWISGAVQTVRIEDPGDPWLELSLSARLGPAPNEHFAEHVVSGQASIGERKPLTVPQHAAPETPIEDERELDERAGERTRALLKQVAALSDGELTGLLVSVQRDVILERMTRYDKAADWQGMSGFRRFLIGGPAEQLLVTFARSAMKAQHHPLAARVAAGAAGMHPQSFEANFQAGVARAQHGEFEEAFRHLRAADKLETGTVRAKREMAALLARQLRGELPADRRTELRSEQLALLRELSNSDDEAIRPRYRISFANALYAAGRYEAAVDAAQSVLALAPNDIAALLVKAKALVARNAIAEAHALYERILDLDPAHRGAKLNIRVLSALIESDVPEREPAIVDIGMVHGLDISAKPAAPHVQLAVAEPDASLIHRLARISQPWICTTPLERGEDVAPQVLAALGSSEARRLGYAEIAMADGRGLEFWRREALIDLAESGLLHALDDAPTLERWKCFYGARRPGGTALSPAAQNRGIAMLVSGDACDGERFLQDITAHHAREGFLPIIVETGSETVGRDGRSNGHRNIVIGGTAADMRKFILENGVALVHAVSGMGIVVAEALEFTNTPFIYGVHSWAELLGDGDGAPYFDAATSEPSPRREFLSILSRATMVYANSRFTQRVIENGFGVRCPVLYSVPAEAG